MVLYSPLIPAWDPVAVRTCLPYRTSRVTIMRVRVVLSETEIERCGRVKLTPPHPQEWVASTTIPIAVSMDLAQSITAGLWRDHVRTNSGKVHKAGEGGGPEIPVVDDVTTVKLDEPALNPWEGGRRINQMTNQKAVC